MDTSTRFPAPALGRRLALLAVLALGALFLAGQAAAATSTYLLVKFKDPQSGPTVVKSLGDTPRALTLGGVEVVDIGASPILNKIQQYQSRTDVVYAEPDRTLSPVGGLIPDDPGYSQWAFAAIDASAGWATFPGSFLDTGGVSVAVLDTGVDASQPDLLGKVAAGADCADPSKSCAAGGQTDFDGHGTAVAGIIGAVADNGQATTGLAYDSPLVPVRVFQAVKLDDGTTVPVADDVAVANGIDWVLANAKAVRVINLSVGGYNTGFSRAGYEQTLCDAVGRALKAGVVVIAAAGNDATDEPSYPAACTGAIGVAATDPQDQPADFSNFGYPNVFVSAPGVGITSLAVGSGLETGDGTSFASPFVAGLSALLLSQDPQRVTPESQFENGSNTGIPTSNVLKQILAETARKPQGATFGDDPRGLCAGCTWNPDYGYGIIDAGQALTDPTPSLPLLDKDPKILPVANPSNPQPADSYSPIAGDLIKVTTGTWAGNVDSFAFQWYQGTDQGCDDKSGTPILDADQQFYRIALSDVGQKLCAVVVARNEAGGVSRFAAPIGPVSAPAPVLIGAPSLCVHAPQSPQGSFACPWPSDTAVYFGDTLKVTTGDWRNSPTSFSYQWLRCSVDKGSCDKVGGNIATYALSSKDVGFVIQVQVTAGNAAGDSVYTLPTVLVKALVPQSLAKPTIRDLTGPLSQIGTGDHLQASTGDWSSIQDALEYKWQRCDGQGQSCVDLGVALERLDVTVPDVAHTLRVGVAPAGSSGAYTFSDPTPAVSAALAAPAGGQPTISGLAQVGGALTTDPGSWSGSPTDFSYQWQGCDAQGLNCAAIAGATDPTLTLDDTLAGATVVVVVVAHNGLDSAPASSDVSDVVAAAPADGTAPVAGVQDGSGDVFGLPTITSSSPDPAVLRPGDVLTAEPGQWTGSQPITFSYQWQRCLSCGDRETEGSWVDLTGQTTTTLTVSLADYGYEFRVLVHGQSPAGSDNAATDATAPVSLSAVVRDESAAPEVQGTAQAGQALVVSDGGWYGDPQSFDYQWQTCDGQGQGCAPIIRDSGVSCQQGSGNDPMAACRQALADRAVQTYGCVTDDAQCESWYVELQPDAANDGGWEIYDHETDQVLQLRDEDVTGDHAFKAYVKAWDSPFGHGDPLAVLDDRGSAVADSTLAQLETPADPAYDPFAESHIDDVQRTSASSIAVGSPPVMDLLPTIEGYPYKGFSLLASAGSWQYNPDGFNYHWLRCNSAGDPASCHEITDNHTDILKLTTLEVGGTVAFYVEATNQWGTTSTKSALVWLMEPQDGQVATSLTPLSVPPPSGDPANYASDKLAVIQDTAFLVAPVNVDKPTISGSPLIGATLTADAGAWDGPPAAHDGRPAFSFQWQLCDKDGKNCVDISGATGAHLVVSDADINGTLGLVVTATNSVGDGTASADPTALVLPAAPVDKTLPGLSGKSKVGHTLHATTGSWLTDKRHAVDAFSYQWASCTDPTFKFPVTTGTSTAKTTGRTTTTATTTVAAKALTTTGQTTTGQTTTSAGGAGQAASPAPVCADVKGATSADYTPVDADWGHQLYVKVTGKNGGGTVTVQSGKSADVRHADAAPDVAITAHAEVATTAATGQTLTYYVHVAQKTAYGAAYSLHLTGQLPKGFDLVSTYSTRGSGDQACVVAASGKFDCNLDFIYDTEVADVTFVTVPRLAGKASVDFTADVQPTDTNLTDNKANVTLTVAKTPVVSHPGPPKLVIRHSGHTVVIKPKKTTKPTSKTTSKTSSKTSKGKKPPTKHVKPKTKIVRYLTVPSSGALQGVVYVDEGAKLTVTIVDGKGRSITLAKGSQLGKTRLKRAAKSLVYAAPQEADVSFATQLSARALKALAKGHYLIRVVAIDVDSQLGKSSAPLRLLKTSPATAKSPTAGCPATPPTTTTATTTTGATTTSKTATTTPTTTATTTPAAPCPPTTTAATTTGATTTGATTTSKATTTGTTGTTTAKTPTTPATTTTAKP